VASTPPTILIGAKQAETQYKERSAIRVVVKGTDDKVVIIKVRKGNYYKLPGGGVENGEDHRLAAEREVAEETGSRVSIEGECVAMTEEYRHDLHQISYCYRAKLLEKTGKPELTEDEVVDGLSHEWVSVAEALELMSTVNPTSELGHYIKARDTFLLTEALKSA
jgi:8-oxo-dGTP diphosphatase